MRIPEEYKTKWFIPRLYKVWESILSGSLRSSQTAVWFINHTELTREEWEKVAPLLPRNYHYSSE